MWWVNGGCCVANESARIMAVGALQLWWRPWSDVGRWRGLCRTDCGGQNPVSNENSTGGETISAEHRLCRSACGHGSQQGAFLAILVALFEVPVYDWTCVSFGPPESTTKTANRSVQPFLHISQQNVAILYNVLRLSILKLHHSHGDLDPHLTYDSLAHPKWHLNRCSRFWTDDCRVSLYFTMGRPFPASKLPLSMVGSGPPHLTRGSLSPPESSTQMASRLVQSFLQGSLMWQRDRPTDRPHYSVDNNGPHLCI